MIAAARACRLEPERVKKRGRVAPHRHVAPRRADQRLVASQVGDRGRLALGVQKPRPAHPVVERRPDVQPVLARDPECADRGAQQPHEPVHVACGRLDAALLRGPGPGEQEAGLLAEHLDRGVREPRFQVDDGCGECRAPSAERVVGQEERGRDVAFAHELLEAVLVDAAGHARVEPEPAHVREPGENAGEIARGRAVRRVAQPRERRRAAILVHDQQRIQPRHLLRSKRIDQRVGREAARHGAPRHPDPLDTGGRGQNDPGSTQMAQHCRGDRLAPFGRFRRAGGCAERAGDVGRLERAQAQTLHRLPGVFEPGLGAMRVALERCGRDVELRGQVPDQKIGDDIVVAYAEAGMTQQGEVQREAEPVGVAALRFDQWPVLIGNRVMLGERGMVEGHAEQRAAFVAR